MQKSIRFPLRLIGHSPLCASFTTHATPTAFKGKMPARPWDLIYGIAGSRYNFSQKSGKPFESKLIPRLYVAAEAQNAWSESQLSLGGWLKLLREIGEELRQRNSQSVSFDGPRFVRWVVRHRSFSLMLVALKSEMESNPFRVLFPGPLPDIALILETGLVHSSGKLESSAAFPRPVAKEIGTLLLQWIAAYRTAVDHNRVTTHLKLINSWQFNIELASALSTFLANKKLLGLSPADVHVVVGFCDECLNKSSAQAALDTLTNEVA